MVLENKFSFWYNSLICDKLMELENEINEEFNKWFQEDLYGPFSFRAEHFYGDCEVEDVKTRKDLMQKWVYAAFYEGYNRGMYRKLEEEQKDN